jgi:chromosome partitioning protein
MFRIVVINPKGGCGKTTLSVNLAAHFSRQGKITTLMDLDPQGSSVFWAHARPESAAEIQLVDAHNCSARVTRSWAIQPPRNTEVLIVDTPARPDLHTIQPLLNQASVILVPLLPTEMDLHAADNFLVQMTHCLASRQKIGVVANRIRANSPGFNKLQDFLAQRKVHLAGSLRDTQNYTNATAQGLGIQEMKGKSCKRDISDFSALAQWCEQQIACQEPTPQAISPSQYVALTNIA